MLGTATVPLGGSAGRHFHHGHELGYVLEGTAILEVEGEPTTTLRAGESYHVEAGRIHDVRNPGPTPARALAVWIVEQGKPLVVPVP